MQSFMFLRGALKFFPSTVKSFAGLSSKWITANREHEMQKVSAQGMVLAADARSDSWMQRTWRPFLGYTLAAVLWMELILIRLINVVLTLNEKSFRIAERELPPEYWVLIISVATVFGGARTWKHLRKSREAFTQHREALAQPREALSQPQVPARIRVQRKAKQVPIVKKQTSPRAKRRIEHKTKTDLDR